MNIRETFIEGALAILLGILLLGCTLGIYKKYEVAATITGGISIACVSLGLLSIAIALSVWISRVCKKR